MVFFSYSFNTGKVGIILADVYIAMGGKELDDMVFFKSVDDT